MQSTDSPGALAEAQASAELVPKLRGADHELRYEIKMAVQESAYTWVRANLFLDTSGIRRLHPPRRVQSVYFDTMGQTALEENLAGISHREKIRFRWYGDDVRSVRGQLERKVRHNQLGWKDVAKIPDPIDVEGASRARFARKVFARLDESWLDVVSGGLQPVQWISYQREYYTTADRSVRITMDRQLCTCDQRGRMHLSSAYPDPPLRVLIVEAKCAEADVEAARRILERFPLVVDKCSKFVIASRPQEGPSVSVTE